MTINSNGTISMADYVSKSGDVAQFGSINPHSTVGGSVSGLPSGQFLYIAEAAATTFKMNPYSNLGATYFFVIG